jgi:hypothetical protein
MPTNRIISLVGVVLLTCAACQRASEAPSRERSAAGETVRSTQIVDDSPVVVEACLDISTAGVQTLAMLAQEDVEPYAISILLLPKVLQAAAESLAKSPETAHVTADWLQNEIRVCTPDPDTMCIRINATESSQSAAIAIIDTVSEAFVKLERDRVQGEIDRLTKAMNKNIGPDATPDQAQAQQVWHNMLATKVFEAVPKVITSARVKNR